MGSAMGTRADFYVGRGEKAEWLGSIAWDGHPESIDNVVRQATTAKEFRKAVVKFLKSRDDATLPKDGWPWPWDDSRTTDYAYAYEKGAVYASCFGYEWFDSTRDEPEIADDDKQVAIFPNMKDIQKVAHGKRSGFMVFRSK